MYQREGLTWRQRFFLAGNLVLGIGIESVVDIDLVTVVEVKQGQQRRFLPSGGDLPVARHLWNHYCQWMYESFASD